MHSSLQKAIILLSLILFSSCGKLMLAIVQDSSIKKNIKVLRNEESQREIVFLPMVHVGTPEYYKEIKHMLDTLRANNYTIIYEGIGTNKELDSISRDIIDRKFRKILNFHLTDYKDSSNQSIPNHIANNKLISQNPESIGLKDTDFRVDLSKEEIIKSYEAEKGEIVLSDCDFETDLMEKYDCKDSVKLDYYFAIQSLRNDYISNTVLASSHQKMVMIYGKAHWFHLYADLQKGGFELVEGKLGTL